MIFEILGEKKEKKQLQEFAAFEEKNS